MDDEAEKYYLPLFSTRLKLADYVDGWIDRNGFEKNTFGVISFLALHGFLNVKAMSCFAEEK